MSRRRVVVTGMGLITPIGLDTDSSWQSALNGVSGGNKIDTIDTSAHKVQIGASLKGFDASQYIDPREASRLDPFLQLGLAAVDQAVASAGIADPPDPERIGIAMGSGIGGIKTIEDTHSVLLDRGPRRVSPFFVPSSVINMISGNASIKHGFKGPNIAIVTACTTGTHNIGYGARMIQYGDADVMVAGGSEWSTTPLTLAGFASMRALSTRNDEPERASRPWDVDRDGFVLGDGAGALVIEEYEHAKQRGADIYCEVTGFGVSADAYHITSPPNSGEGAIASMRNALADAKLAPDDVQYVNAHGTSTPQGDIAETLAIKEVFGADSKVAVSSSKSMIGHLLGAAGAVEAGFCALSLRDQRIHPTINLDNQDPACDLDYVPHTARDAKLEHVLSNSFGFGGTNGSLIFSRV
ncbi:MAG: beta-ketoacyl-ACP synthase II [Gammaproteobacteria bacterium]|nr:beta-ketoacyl-ACP synthase II [Gammaproteobacteria bacterium]